MDYFRPYKYVKDESSDPIYRPFSSKFVFSSIAYPVLFTSLGVLVLVTQIIFPLIEFKTRDTVSRVSSLSVLGVASGFRDFSFDEYEHKYAFGEAVNNNVPKYFYLSIPKLRIKDALVESNSPDLDPTDALGHYSGSMLPGEIGNSFIFGHSVLPVFYNPKNYKAIFSTLDRLRKGDVFTIEYNNKIFRYVVEQKRYLKPKDANPLDGFKPKYLNESTVTLMTCHPPGTKYKRLFVDAILVD